MSTPREGVMIVDPKQGVAFQTPGAMVYIDGEPVGTTISMTGSLDGMPIVTIPADEA